MIQTITAAKQTQMASQFDIGGLYPDISTTIIAMLIAQAMDASMIRQQKSRAAAPSRMTVWVLIAML